MEKQTRNTYSECVCSVAVSILHAMRMRFIVICGLCETFLILRRIQQDMIKMCIDFHVKCALFLFDLLEILVFSTDFRKYSKYHFTKIRPVRADWFRADGHDEANGPFSQFCGCQK